ncbi:MAG: EamA family transporter [Candidatus Methanomethylophilaceae archaeon]|nr:EamA family transporter [Candidatus Methanomethylophilaceae archaeon]
MDKNRTMAVVGVIIGASLFGMLGICARYFGNEWGLNALDTVLIRLMFSVIFLLLLILLFSPSSLKIRLKDIPFFILFGLFKIGSDVTFFYAQGTIELSMATLLQMTAPYYVLIISIYLFKDTLTWKKLSALVLGSIGCLFVTGVINGRADLELTGVLAALVSGLCFGMFVIGSRIAYNKGVKPEASLFYTILIADLIVLPFADVDAVVTAVINPEGLVMALALGILMTMVPYFILAWSVKYLEPTLTSILSVFELVVAGIVGYLMFDEELSLFKILGITLVMGSIILLNIRLRVDYRKKVGKYIPLAYRNKDRDSSETPQDK